MDERLRKLRHTMESKTFGHLSFTEEHRKEVHKKIKQADESEGAVILIIMQLLTNEKSGYEINQHLYSRGVHKFEDNEGFLYTVLHRLEQKGYLRSRWSDSRVKYYQLSDKGKKLLKREEKLKPEYRLVLKELLEG